MHPTAASAKHEQRKGIPLREIHPAAHLNNNNNYGDDDDDDDDDAACYYYFDVKDDHANKHKHNNEERALVHVSPPPAPSRRATAGARRATRTVTAPCASSQQSPSVARASRTGSNDDSSDGNRRRTSAATTATPTTPTTTPLRRASATTDSASLTTKDNSTQSLSAGSTASVDSFVRLMTCGDGDVEHPLDLSNSSSSYGSFDPYLSRRRKPSWAKPDHPAVVGICNSNISNTQVPTTPASIDGRKAYVRQQQNQQQQQQQHPPRRGRNPLTKDEAEAFARRQRDIERQLQAMSVLQADDDEPQQQWKQHDHDSDDDDDDGFPRHDHLQSSFFTAESLLLRRNGGGGGESHSGSGGHDLAFMDGNDDYDDGDDAATDEMGFPRQLTSIPTPTVTKIQLRDMANRRQSLLDVTATSVASLGGDHYDDDDDNHDPHHHSRSNASSYSSAKTADAGVHSLPSRSQAAADAERARHAIQTVLHWRHIVSLRSQQSPRWITASTLGAGGNEALKQQQKRRPNGPSLALARAHLQLGNALLAIHEPSEACKSFQAAYKIFCAQQPRAAAAAASSRHVLSMALCMERMGVATSLAAEPVAVVPAPSSPSAQPGRQRSISEQVQSDPSFAMLVRSYTVQLESFRLRSIHLGSHHVDVISGLNHIAKLHCHNRDWVRALQCLWQVYWARSAVFGPIHPSCGVTAHDVANVFCQLRMLDDASNFYSIASHVYDTLNLPEHNPALRKLNRDVKRLERIEHRQGYNVL
jgi:hypothetical protein